MTRLQANLLLLTAAACWGLGNVAQKTVLEHLDPMAAAGLRCLVATAVVAPFALAERWGRAEPGWTLSLGRVALLFAVAIAFQQAAYLDATVTNAGFLVNTATVMTPLAAWWLIGERPGRPVAAAAALTLVGALLMSGGLGGPLGAGDSLAVVSAAFYAFWMVELGRHMRRFGRPVSTAAAQFGFTALLLVPAGMAFGAVTPAQPPWPPGPSCSSSGCSRPRSPSACRRRRSATPRRAMPPSSSAPRACSAPPPPRPCSASACRRSAPRAACWCSPRSR